MVLRRSDGGADRWESADDDVAEADGCAVSVSSDIGMGVELGTCGCSRRMVNIVSLN